MTWNYRIVRFKEPDRKKYYYKVCEVYYTDQDEPKAYCDASIANGTIKGVFKEMQAIAKDMAQAYLKYPEDFKEQKGE